MSNNIEIRNIPQCDADVPEEVDDFYLKLWLIRDTGATNMFSPQGVADVAEQLGYDDFVDWLTPDRGTRHNEDYGELLQADVKTVAVVDGEEKQEATLEIDNGEIAVEFGEGSWVKKYDRY